MLLFSLTAALAAPVLSPAPDAGHRADAAHLLHLVETRYAYFGELAPTWEEASEGLLKAAEGAASRNEFIRVLEAFLAAFADDHTFLNTNRKDSERLSPSGIDVWPTWQDGLLVIESVRPGSAAFDAGLRIGDEVAQVGGVPAAELARSLVHPARKAAHPRVAAWSARRAVAGRRDRTLDLVVRSAGADREISYTPWPAAFDSLLTARELPGGIAHIAVHDSLYRRDLVEAFDRALDSLPNAKGLILDLRDTASGGNTVVARGLMGRLVKSLRPYQRHQSISEERETGIARVWVEHVAPRGAFQYEGPVVVLVSRWTGSMGEGITIGLASMGRARVVGTPMAGLRGAVGTFSLPITNIPVTFPTERMSTPAGAPRELFEPDVFAASTGAAIGSPDDRGLKAAIAELRKGR